MEYERYTDGTFNTEDNLLISKSLVCSNVSVRCLASSVGRGWDLYSQGSGFKPHVGAYFCPLYNINVNSSTSGLNKFLFP